MIIYTIYININNNLHINVDNKHSKIEPLK